MRDPHPEQTEDIETALLYSILIDRQQIHAAREIISADDMTGTRRRLFAEISDMVDGGGDHADLTQLVSHLRSVDALGAVGGMARIAKLMDSSGYPPNAPTYARQIKNLANRRRVAALLRKASAEIQDPMTSLDSLLDSLIRDATATRATESARGEVSAYEAGLLAIEHLEQESDSEGGVYSGIPAVDECFGTFTNGSLTTIAARTSVGKSGVCVQSAVNIAMDGKKVLYFSLEMPSIEIARRFLGNDAGVCSQQMANRSVDASEIAKLRNTLDRYRELGLFINDSSQQSASTVAASARNKKATTGLDALFIDHIGLVEYPERFRSDGIANFSRSMKRLARELEIPVFMASQINREGDKAEGCPKLSHIADSTSVEADSDNVIILYRPKPLDPETIFSFAKVRNGRIGRHAMRMDLPSTWFVDADAPTREQTTPHDEFLGYDTGFGGGSNGSF
ncbi:replicative DNA helicase [Allorhodopirellula solitaria]|uniref:DNA 5'-3' helicase n=1 Tax=Allorhodopirellula solitaria TaxID=2527987 RepID=A0A5C5X1M9_9BACT|nr:DnaB-like helicase C-terminal domain-containing protein [Allorhodopirellula solitaria]TWT56509.1 Replicative DNA helicase [Allorhodopirellula solitaria]